MRVTNKVFFDGKMRLMNNNRTVVLSFYSREILRQILTKRFDAIATFDSEVTMANLEPAYTGTRLYSDGRYAICLAVTKSVPRKIVAPDKRYRKVKVALIPSDFGLLEEDLIEDNDGKRLFPALKKMGFALSPVVSTCNNQRGDLCINKSGERLSVQITRYNPLSDTSDKKLKLRHYIIGRIAFQCFQATRLEESRQIAILNQDLKTKNVITQECTDFLKANKIALLFSDFAEGWEEKASRQIAELTK